ncbi:hypothetical protein PoB_002476300 [Plakobranchus ocellatus]|uniref:Uncharacterized protein n=1 Tax=Plakobranchus ocellatus TaxID=259542 RepID=A0AAV3ZV05_9GAST|nr:hypothetical protein PoB_002476300 [Plakobranchus ocellatus]
MAKISSQEKEAPQALLMHQPPKPDEHPDAKSLKDSDCGEIELEAIRSEVLKKCKIAEEKEIKKPHIYLPQEIIPRAIKKEIDEQNREAERRQLEQEARALKMEKQEKKAAKRKQHQAVLNQILPRVLGRLTGTAENVLGMEGHCTTESNKTKNLVAKETTLLEKHLLEYQKLMKEQPKRHTVQQLEEERKRMQQILMIKQEEELMKLRSQKSVELSSKPEVTEEERRTVLIKLREKEAQRNLEEMEEAEVRIKQAKRMDLNMDEGLRCSYGKSVMSDQRRAGRGRGRQMAHRICNPSIQIAENKSETALAKRTVDQENAIGAQRLTADAFAWAWRARKDGAEKLTAQRENFQGSSDLSSVFQIQYIVPPEGIGTGSKTFSSPEETSHTTSDSQGCLSGAAFSREDGLKFTVSSPFKVESPMEHSTPLSSHPLLYSSCLKNQTNVHTFSHGKICNMEDASSIGDNNEKSTTDSNNQGKVGIPEKCPQNAGRTIVEEVSQTRECASSNKRELNITRRKIFESEPCMNKQDSLYESRRTGREFQDQPRHNSNEKKMWTHSSNFCSLEKNYTPLPAPTIDDWMKARQASCKKPLSTPHSNNSSLVSKSDGHSDNSLAQSDKSLTTEDVKDEKKCRASENGVKIQSKDFSSAQPVEIDTALKDKEKVARVRNPPLKSASTECEDWLSLELSKLSLQTEPQKDPTYTSAPHKTSEVKKKQIASDKFEKCNASAGNKNASSGSSLPVSAPQGQVDSSTATSDICNPGLRGQSPGFSFPAGVYLSDQVQKMALALHQQQQQLLLMSSYNFQTRMMMLASNTDTAGNQQKSNSDSEQVDKQRRKELSDKDLHAILTKVSRLSCSEKTVQTSKKNSLNFKPSDPSLDKKRSTTANNAGNKWAYQCEEENWEHGIEMDSKFLPHSKNESASFTVSSSLKNKNGCSFPTETMSSHLSLKSRDNDKVLSEERVNAILKKVPGLISDQTVLRFGNVSESCGSLTKEVDIESGCSRPLRKPSSAMRCRKSVRNFLQTPAEEKFLVPSTSTRCSDPHREGLLSRLSKTRTFKNSLERNDSEQLLTLSEGNLSTAPFDVANSQTFQPGHQQKSSKPTARTFKRPDNPARLIKAALSQLKKREGSQHSCKTSCLRPQLSLSSLTDFPSLDYKRSIPEICTSNPGNRSQCEPELDESVLKNDITNRKAEPIISIKLPPPPPSSSSSSSSSTSKLVPRNAEVANIARVDKVCAEATYLQSNKVGEDRFASDAAHSILPTKPTLSVSKLMPKLCHFD